MTLNKLGIFVGILMWVSAAQADLISEFEPNPDGSDPTNQMVELEGTPNASYNFTLLTIEGDGSAPGVIDRAATVSGTFDANGFDVAMVPDFENPAFTLVVADGFTGAVGDDLDTDDDGVLDVTPWTSVCDALGIPDSLSGDTLYGSSLGGADFTYHDDPAIDSEPVLVYRDDATGNWVAIYEDDQTQGSYFGFNLDGTADGNTYSSVPTTYGGPNIIVPEPSSWMLIMLAGLSLIGIRRK